MSDQPPTEVTAHQGGDEPTTAESAPAPAPSLPAEDASSKVPREYFLILMAVVADGEVDPAERQMLKEYAEEHPECVEHHEALLAQAGWTVEEYEVGYKEGDPRRLNPEDEGAQADTKNLLSASALADDPNQTIDLEEALAQANARFLAVYFEEMKTSVEATCKEVIAAKVPLASYGRVRDALDGLRKTLNGRARELLTQELSELERVAVMFVNAKTAELENEKKDNATLRKKVDTLKTDAEEALAARDAAQKEMAEMADRIKDPQKAIQRAQDSVDAMERKLAKAHEKAHDLQEQIRISEEEWETNLIHCLKKNTFKMKGSVENPSKDPRKANFGPSAIHFDIALSKLEGGHGARLAYLVGKYEEAKASQKDKLNEEREEARVALEGAGKEAKVALVATQAEMKQKEKAWDVEREQLEKALNEAKVAMESRVEALKTFKEEHEATTVPVAKHEKLEAELTKVQAALKDVQLQLQEKSAALDAMTVSRDKTEKSLAREQELRVGERARLSQCLKRLYEAQSAAKYGGYFFSAAPVTSPSRQRGHSLSPERQSDAWKSGQLSLSARTQAEIQRAAHLRGLTPGSPGSPPLPASPPLTASPATPVASPAPAASPPIVADSGRGTRSRKTGRKPSSGSGTPGEARTPAVPKVGRKHNNSSPQSWRAARETRE